MKKILFLTNAEHGQANVFLAAAHALLTLGVDLEVHFASFNPISASVSSTSDYALQCAPKARPIVFHRLGGISMLDALLVPEHKFWETMGRRPGLRATTQFMWQMMRVVMPWSATDFMRVYRSVVGAIEEVCADVVVVDSMFSPGLTACRQLNLNHVVLAPNALKDFASAVQPWGALLWKYPMWVFG